MPDRLLGILRHQGLEFAFGPFVVEEGLPSIAEQGANSAQEFEEPMSTMRMASMRGRGGSAMIR